VGGRDSTQLRHIPQSAGPVTRWRDVERLLRQGRKDR
jgi:hypothetical protein